MNIADIYIYIYLYIYIFKEKKRPVFSLKKYCSVKSIKLSSVPGKFKCSAPE